MQSHIFFDPAHTYTPQNPSEPQGRAAHKGFMTHKDPLLPHGPHAILQFPTDVLVKLEDEEPLESQDHGYLLTHAVSSLYISGTRGSVLFKCARYLTSFDIFFVPSESSEHKASLGVRLLNTSPQTQRLFHSFCRDLPLVVAGVTTGYVRNLYIGGIGNKVSVNGQIVTFTTGLSHLLSVQLPPSIQATSESPTQLTLHGLNKEEVFQWASRLRHHTFHKNVYAKPLLQFEGEEVLRKETRKK